MSSIFANLGAQYKAPAGGLFSNLGNTTNATSNSGQTENTSNPFAGLGTNVPRLDLPAASSPGGIFGNASTSKPAETSGGLGGGSTGANLFGNLGASAKPAGSGLFQNLGQSQAPAASQPPTASGLFGSSFLNNNSQPQQNQTQNQGQAMQENTQPIAGSSQPAYFDRLLERGKKRHNQDHGISGTQFDELPSLQLGLGDIARKVRNLGQGGPSAQGAQIGRINGVDNRANYFLAASGVNAGASLRDLNALESQTTPRPAAPQHGAFDTDLATYVDGIQRQNTLSLIEKGLDQARRDFDAFLEENVQMEWDAQRRRIYEHFGIAKKGDDVDGTLANNTRSTFGRSTRRGKNLGASMNGASFGTSGLAKSVIGSQSVRGGRASLFNDVAEKASAKGIQPAPEDRQQREKQDKLAKKVEALNIARLQETVYPVLQQFVEIEALPSIEDTTHYVNSYKALIFVTGENASVQRPSDPGAIRERQYASDYLDEDPSSARSVKIRQRILSGSRSFLESLFYSNLESAINKNPREANLGGVPTTINKVRAFVRLCSARKELGAENVELQTLGEDYCWVLIYYLLRSGMLNEAVQYVTENERAIKAMDRNFPLYLQAYVSSQDRRLSPDMQNKISAEYSQRSRNAPENTIDPYRMACCKIIGRCELGRRNLDNISQSMEDWIWLQFVLAREVNRATESAGEVFELDDLRTVIRQIGERHFESTKSEGGEGASVGPGTYFFLQILAGMFEKAVAWLYAHNYVSAVHFAIALDFYGLLRVSDFGTSEDLLSVTTKEQPQISFGRMLGYYTRDFRARDATAAADYLVLINLNADLPGSIGQRQTELSHEALRELVLETREFAQLLGDIRSDGQRVPGAIEKRLKLIGITDEKSYLKRITVQAAQIADDNGRVTDAVLLYHLAEEYDMVATVINRAVSDAVAVEVGAPPLRLEPIKSRNDTAAQQQLQQGQQPQPESSLSLTATDDPVQLANNTFTLYNRNAIYTSAISKVNQHAAGALISINAARTAFQYQNWDEVIRHIANTNLLPLDSHGNTALTMSRANNLPSMPSVLSRHIGMLLIWTVTAAANLAVMARNALYDTQTATEKSERAEVMRQDCVVFAGLLRYKLPASVFEVLARLEGERGGVY
ncbi:nuclear pore complex subunit [Elasticomyces elasticus]|nr:nuclear pore complex subunit [Elasticomyces elasticus]